jgi:hypothetical protein
LTLLWSTSAGPVPGSGAGGAAGIAGADLDGLREQIRRLVIEELANLVRG